MKKIFLLILIIISVAAIHSCQKEITGEPDNTPTGSEVDVYVAGLENNGAGVRVAKYWKNGQAVSLSDSTNDAVAYSIAVVGSDVYVAGAEGCPANTVAKYWKNGQAVSLTNGTNDAVAFSIAVMGSDVYVAGGEGFSS